MLQLLSNFGLDLHFQLCFKRVVYIWSCQWFLNLGVEVSFGFRCQTSFYSSKLLLLLSIDRKVPSTIVIWSLHFNSDVKDPLRFDFKFVFEWPFLLVRVMLAITNIFPFDRMLSCRQTVTRIWWKIAGNGNGGGEPPSDLPTFALKIPA